MDRNGTHKSHCGLHVSSSHDFHLQRRWKGSWSWCGLAVLCFAASIPNIQRLLQGPTNHPIVVASGCFLGETNSFRVLGTSILRSHYHYLGMLLGLGRVPWKFAQHHGFWQGDGTIQGRTSGMLLMSYTGPTLDWHQAFPLRPISVKPIPILTNSMPSRMHWSSGATMALNVTACIPGPHDGTQKMKEHEWQWHWPPGMDHPWSPHATLFSPASRHSAASHPSQGSVSPVSERSWDWRHLMTWSVPASMGQPHFSWPWNFVEITTSAMMDRHG